MKISILLPYKEDYTSKYSGAVSIHVSNLFKYSKLKKDITIFGNTNNTDYLSDNYKNIKINQTYLSSSNKKYIKKFIDIQKINQPDIIEIHNRPNYVDSIFENLNSKIIYNYENFYFVTI